MTPLPPTPPTPEQLATLRWMLGDTVEPYAFTDDQLAALIASAGSLEGAAALGWTAKAMAATEARGGMIEYRIGTESVRYMDPTDFRELALANAKLWQGLIPDPLTAASIYAIVQPVIISGCEPWERDLSRLDEELLERPILRRRPIIP